MATVETVAEIFPTAMRFSQKLCASPWSWAAPLVSALILFATSFVSEAALSPPNTTGPGELTSPGPIHDTYSARLRWNSVAGATGYEVYIRDVDTDEFREAPVGNVTSYTFGDLVQGNRHRWNMRSRDASGLSGISQTRYFRVGRPDLRFVGTSTVTPEIVSPGESVRIEYTVENAGDGEAKSSSTRVQIKFEDETTTVVEEFDFLPGLDAGEEEEEFRILRLPDDARLGLYSVHLILDRESENIQSDYDNDFLSLWYVFEVARKPDLKPVTLSGYSAPIVVSKVQNTTTDDAMLLATDTLYLDWNLINDGDAATTRDFYTRLFIDGAVSMAWTTHSPLAIGSAAAQGATDFNLGSLAAGEHSLRIEVDYADAVDEWDESNNAYAKTITIGSPPGPVITVDNPNGGSPMTTCGSYNITWTVSGDASEIINFRVSYSLDGGASFIPASSSIPAHERTYAWTIPQGTASSQVRVQVVANKAGEVEITRAMNPNNATISIPSGNPVAIISAPNHTSPGTVATFSGANSYAGNSCSDVSSYQWKFYDAQNTITKNGRSVTYQFSASGSYRVELKVTDSDGKTGTDSTTVIVDGFAAGTASTGLSLSRDPVNLANGNYLYEHVDLLISGKGFPFEFKRFYNSKFRVENPPIIGIGWTHSYNISLTNSSTNVFITFGDGHVQTFFGSGIGDYATEVNSGVYDSLTKNPDQSWTLTSKEQMRHNFTADGLLAYIADKNGNTLALAYSANRLAAVTNSSGRLVTFTPHPNGCVGSITDPIGRTIRFEYDDQTNLVRCIDANGGTNIYAYDANHQIVAAFDARGTRYVTNIYDPEQRVVSSQSDANGSPTGFFYDFTNHITYVTNAFGKVATQRFDERLLVTNIVDEAGNQQSFAYDENRNRTFIRDKNGNETHYAYDARGNVTNKIDALTNVTSIEYNSLNNPIRRVDALINTTTFGYDSIGNLTSTTNALNHVSQIQYTNAGLPYILTDARGFSTTNEFDPQGNLVAVIDAKGFTNQFGYDDAGRRVRHIDTLNRTNCFIHDDNDNLLHAINGLGFTNSHIYDANNNRVISLDPRGVGITNIFDLKERLVVTIGVLDSFVSNRYDALDRKVEMRDALGNPTYFVHDDVGNLIAVTNALGEPTRFTHDPNGNQTSVIGPTDHYITNSFDVLNRKTVTIDIGIATNSTAFDKLWRVIATTNANGQVTQFFHDAIGRLTNVVDFANQPVFFDYDGNGNRVRTVDPKGQAWTNVFDELNRLVEQSDSHGKTIFQYDPVGNVTNKITPNGHRIAYSHDALNRLTNISYPTGPPVTFAYDSVGNRTNMTDGLGTTTWQYDDLNRLTSVTDPYSQTVANSFDAQGNRVSVTYPGNKVVRYGFDALNRMVAFTNWHSGFVTYAFDSRGNLLATTNANNTTASYGYDDGSRLLSVTNARSDGSVIAGYALSLDGIGNHLQSSHEQPLFPILPNQTNRYTCDSDNRLITLDGQPVTHDTNGNLKSIGPQTFAYDFEDRLVEFTITNVVYTFAYDGIGNRLARSANGHTRRFVLDPMAALTQVLAETDTNSSPFAYYLYGLGLAQQITPDGQVATCHFDVRGSTIALTDSAGNVTDSYAFDSFGVLANSEGDSPQPFRYLGGYGIIDDSTGFYYARARYFSPHLGRFLTKDHVTGRDSDRQSFNRYVYALNNPVRLIDVSGLSSTEGQFYSSSGSTDTSHAPLLRSERERRLYIAQLEAEVARQNYLGALEVEDAYYQAAINYFGALSIIGEVAGYAADVLSLGGSAIFRNAFRRVATGAVNTPPALTGQIHHGISRQVHKALEQHPNLKGVYQARDPRFVTQAKDAASHQGYQQWHRNLDAEVSNWVRSNPNATPQQFENYLQLRYSQPDLSGRFPNGL